MRFLHSVFVLLLTYCAANNLMLTPVKSKLDKPAAALIFFPGAEINASAYQDLLYQIQKDSDYELWVAAVGDWMANTVNPLQLPGHLEDAITSLHKGGLPEGAPIYVAGHSLAGVFLDMYVRQNPTKVSGLLMFASYISQNVNMLEYPIPVLHISGDQDGLCPLTRMTKQFVKLNAKSANDVLRTPVLLVPGVNHSQVASGPMPPNVVKYDIESDATYYEAHERLSNLSNAFLTWNGPVKNESLKSIAREKLEMSLMWTNGTTYTYQVGLIMDGGDSDVPSTAAIAQDVLTTFYDDTNFTVMSHNVSLVEFVTFPPLITKLNDTNLNVNVPFEMVDPINPLDISTIQQSPVEMLVRTVSKEKLLQWLPNAKIQQGTCKLVNKVFEQMVSLMDYNRYQRYKSKGRVLVFKPDLVKSTILGFFTEHTIQFTDTKDGKVEVISPVYNDGDELWCSTLTLTRAAEWVYVDAFRTSTD